MTEFTGQDLAQSIGVPTQTVDAWVEEFCIPYENSQEKQRQYNQDALEILQSIKNLRDQNKGFNTIKQKLSLPQGYQSPLENQVDQLLEKKLSRMLDDKFETYLNIQDKYAEAQFRLGQLTEQGKRTLEDNERLKAQLKLLPSPDEWFALKEREKMAQDLLFGLQEQIDELQKELAGLKGTQWPISPELKALHSEESEQD